jgi:uncharacterized protein YhbP (UPF0306 family)
MKVRKFKLSQHWKRKLSEFIASKNICTLATCFRNKPRASTVNYVSDGFSLYVVTSSKSTKVRNINSNPHVSIAIDDQGKTRLCLQAEGIARVLEGKEKEKAMKYYCERRDISKHSPELVDTIIRIDLKEIMFSDYTTGELKVFRFKNLLKL